MSTTTYELSRSGQIRAETVAGQIADALSAATRQFLRAIVRLTAAQPTRAQSAAELLRLADEYERSQPSYAADLRAAAQRSQ